MCGVSQAGQEGYLDVFLSELEAFKGRVRESAAKTKGGDVAADAKHQAVATPPRRLDPKEVLESLPPVSLPRCFPAPGGHDGNAPLDRRGATTCRVFTGYLKLCEGQKSSTAPTILFLF